MLHSNDSLLVTQGNVSARGRASISQLLDRKILQSACYFEHLESTNTTAIKYFQEAEINRDSLPRLIVADQQTSGRGRHGRSWNSDTGTLTFSLVISTDEVKKRERIAGLGSIAVGVAIARCVEYEFAPLKIRLKWPNDIYLGGGKLGGILMEMIGNHPEYVVIGVGVNVSTTPRVTDRNRSQSVASLSHTLGRDVHRYDLLPLLVEAILSAVGEAVSDHENLIDDFRQRCLLTGQEIEYQDGLKRETGTCLGVASDGALRVLGSQGATEICSGEANLVRSLGH